MPRRQPRWPSIGLFSCSSLDLGARPCPRSTPSAVAVLADVVVVVRQELVQRRVERADRHRALAHDAEDAREVVALHRQQLGQRGLARLGRVGEDHLAHAHDAVAAEEHVLGAAEADALGAERDGVGGLVGLVGVGAHASACARASAHSMMLGVVAVRVASPRASCSSRAAPAAPRRAASRSSPRMTSPVKPSMRHPVALLDRRTVDAEGARARSRCRARRSRRRRPCPSGGRRARRGWSCRPAR